MIKKSILLIAAMLSLAGFTGNSVQAAGSPNGAGGVMPAYYDDELFTINLKELSDDAAERIIENNASLNVIYECDSCPGFIAVIDAIQGDGFNPLWLEVQIEFIGGNPPHQFTSDEEIDEAEEAGEIRFVSTGEVYRCSVIGTPQDNR